MLRTLDDFFWVLRRVGLAVAVPQAIDAMRALEQVGIADRSTARAALACVLVTQQTDRARFDAAFDQFFSPRGGHARDIAGKLEVQGFTSEAIAVAGALLAALAEAEGPGGDVGALRGMLESESGLRHLLLGSDVDRLLLPMANASQAGFFTQRTLTQVGASRAAKGLMRLRRELVDALGEAEGNRLADALKRELDLAGREVRAFVEDRAQALVSTAGDAATRAARTLPFSALTENELREVRRAVRALGERLRGAARARERKARRGGHVDAQATVRAAMRTGGVPMTLVRRARRRERPRLWVLCDVSDSVRVAATFMLEFMAVVHELFARTRAFVFVSELGEATKLFEDEPVDRAIAQAYGGAIVPVTHNSNYGRVFRQFDARHGRELDRRATVVIVGDGRTNYQPPDAGALASIRDRVRTVLWLCPEPRATWGAGDSAMRVYAPIATAVLPASTASELEAAAREILVRR